MHQKRLGQIDLDTGEILEHGMMAVLMPKRRNAFREGWVAMAQEATKLLAKQKDLGLDGFRVLMLLISMLDFENLIQISQAEVAKELEMQRSNVARAIKRLISTGALLEGPRIGVHRSYRLNPRFGWKGSAMGHHSAIQERAKAIGMSVVAGGRDNLSSAELETLGQSRLFD